MIIGFLGDIHGRFEDLKKILKVHPHVHYWVQVGDLGGEELQYPELPSNFWFVQGNHENWESLIDKSHPIQRNYLKNGRTLALSRDENTIFVSSFGGNYSPKFWDSKRKDLPLQRNRHFLQEEYDCLLEQQLGQDILVTHEAPSPYTFRGRDLGQPIISDLIENIVPRLHVFGHHHHYTVKRLTYEHSEVLSVGLPYGTQGFITYDTASGIVSPKMFERNDSNG
ncbi:MAG: hypothetical protein GF334_01355 [Candidatus Altiarchaeales archaeon]|nr:hypothetical protein [Candidatus Altiarchaeales archaeon]